MAADEDSNGDWQQNRRMVLYRLGTIDERLGAMNEQLTSIDRQLARLGVRASIWGALGGLLMAGLTAAVARHFLG